MPYIYYCNSLAKNDLGILRAVLSREESRNLLKLFSVRYAGPQFPTMTQQNQSFAVLDLPDHFHFDRVMRFISSVISRIWASN